MALKIKEITNEIKKGTITTINLDKRCKGEIDLWIYCKKDTKIDEVDNINTTTYYNTSRDFYESKYHVSIRRWYGDYAGEAYTEFIKVKVKEELYNGNWVELPEVVIESHNNNWIEEKVQEHYKLCDACTKLVREAAKWGAEHWTI